jgi:hypothetical protein
VDTPVERGCITMCCCTYCGERDPTPHASERPNLRFPDTQLLDFLGQIVFYAKKKGDLYALVN